MYGRMMVPAALLLALPIFAQAADKPIAKSNKPGVVLRFASLDHLRGDFRYLAEVVGQAEKAKQFDALIKSKLGEKGFEGIDSKKPLGAYAWVGAQGVDSRLVLLVPIAKEKDFVDLIASQFDVKPEKGDDGVYTIEVEKLHERAYLRFANNYVYITVRDKDLLDKDKLLAPAAVFPAGQADVLSLSVDIDQIPINLKELALGAIENRLADLKERELRGHTKAQKAFRDAAVDEMGSLVKTLFNDGGVTTLKLHLDRKSGNLELTASVAGKAGSELAADIQKLSQVKSFTAALPRSNSALKGELNVRLSEKLRTLLEPALQDGEKQALAKAGATEREVLNTLLEGIRPTLKAAELDTAIDLQGPSETGGYTLVSGVKIKDGRNLEKSFRKSAAQYPRLIKLDVEKVDQINIHRINADKNLKPGAVRSLGENPAYVAFGNEVMFLGAGEKGLAALKEMLAAAPTTGKVVDLQVAVSRLLSLADNETAAAIARKVFGEDKEGDRLHLSVEGGKTLTVRLAIKAKLIEYLNQVEKAKKNADQ